MNEQTRPPDINVRRAIEHAANRLQAAALLVNYVQKTVMADLDDLDRAHVAIEDAVIALQKGGVR